MEATLKFIKLNPWVGITKYKGCADYIGSYWTRSGNRYTGLTDIDANRLELAIGYPEGHLAPHSSFWATFAIRLADKELVMHTERPEDELKYLFLKSHKRVADGTTNVKPTNDYLLTNKDFEAEESNKRNKLKREAFTEFNKMSLDEMRKCLRLYGLKSDSISAELVEDKLFQGIESDPAKFIALWVNNKNKNTQYIIETAISKNVIRKNKNVYYYGTDVIGRSLEDTISMLDNNTNQDIKMAIMQEIESK